MIYENDLIISNLNPFNFANALFLRHLKKEHSEIPNALRIIRPEYTN
jgi:hypothetical protein